METPTPHQEWLNRGCQRRAVAAVLNHPMTPAQILLDARKQAPRIQLRDIWLILNQMKDRGLVTCMNPDAKTGKLFCHPANDILIDDVRRENADWHLYSWIVRGRVRATLCNALADLDCRMPCGLTPSEIRRAISTRIPVGKNSILRVLGELSLRNLVVSTPLTRRSRQRRYRLSQYCNEILRSHQIKEAF